MTQQTKAEKSLLAAAVGVCLGAQALVVLSSLVLPVIAALVLPALGLPKAAVGWYSSTLFVIGTGSTLSTPLLVAWLGPVRLHQAMLACAALGLCALAAGQAPLLLLSAMLIGLAYGPANPASSVLLARLAPPRLRNQVFSLKQLAVPVGGAASGLVVPLLAAGLGWRAGVLALAALLALGAIIIQRWRLRLDGDFLTGDRPRLSLWAPLVALRQGGPVLWLGLTGLCYASIQFTFSAFVVTVLVASAGWSIAGAGVALTVGLMVSIAARLVMGWLADRVAPMLVQGGLGLLMAVACLAGLGLGPATPAALVYLVAGLFGLAAFGWNGVCLAETARLAPQGQVAAASAGVMTLIYGGACLGPAVFGAALALSGGPGSGFVILALMALAPLAWLRLTG